MLMFASLATVLAAVSAAPYSTFGNGYSSFGSGFGSGYGSSFGSGFGTGFGTGYSKVLPSTLSTGYVAPAGFSNTYSSGLFGGFGTGYGPFGRGYSNSLYGSGLGYGSGLAYGSGMTYGAGSVAPLAVQSQHNVQHYDVPSGGNIQPIGVTVDSAPIPINMHMKSSSSILNVQQAHEGTQGSFQESQSEDEPHVLRHSVTKPVIQQVKEVITPFRKITQEVQPVQESIETLVARGTNRGVAYGNNYGTLGTVGTVGTVGAFAAPLVSNTYGSGLYNTGYSTGRVMAAPFARSNYGYSGYSGFSAPAVATTGYSTGFAAPLAHKAYSTGFSTGYGSPSLFANKIY